MIRYLTICCLLCLTVIAGANPESIYDTTIRPADALPQSYVPLLTGKRVGLIINQTSKVGDSSLLDILLRRGVQVTSIFVPEHGFRGKEDAGAHIDNTIDSATGIPVISLYGSHKKPRADDLKNIDVLVYDLQDVGVRFYTYISTLQYCMQACAQNDRQLIILDRPNPNGFYVDGPVLQKTCTSFVGMQTIPIVYGMTAGEYAQMLIGEKWIDSSANLDIKVIRCENYTHKKKYKLPVSPSPNLRTMAAVYAYPSLCLFEGTVVSVGRGTDKPFEQYGCPEFAGKYSYSFTPISGPGAKKPMYEGMICYGDNVGEDESKLLSKLHGKIDIHGLIAAYNNYPNQDKFFTSFFHLLSGTDALSGQIKGHLTEQDIRKSWQNDLKAFRKVRKKYLLYEDFEN